MYQDIHLVDKQKWDNVQTDWANDSYENMLNKLQDIDFSEKVINADMFSAICDSLLVLENQYFDDDDFKADRIKVSITPPTEMSIGQVYFKLD